MNRGQKGSLLQVSTDDGLYLHGYFAPSTDKKVAVLHIHGFEGNFYENNFVHVLAKELEDKNIGFLTVNTRGNGRDTDFNMVDGNYNRIGAHYELLEEAHLDISAWMKVLIDEGYQEIVLQGHSLGTMKVARYLFEGKYKDKVSKLIFLAAFDKQGLMIASKRNVQELIVKAKQKVAEGKAEEIITKEFEDIPMSYQTFLSWYGQDDLGRVFEFSSPNYDFPILRQIKVPTKIIVGNKDEFFYQSDPAHPEVAMKILLDKIPQAQGVIIDGAVHSYKPHEDRMAQEVSSFILGK